MEYKVGNIYRYRMAPSKECPNRTITYCIIDVRQVQGHTVYFYKVINATFDYEDFTKGYLKPNHFIDNSGMWRFSELVAEAKLGELLYGS